MRCANGHYTSPADDQFPGLAGCKECHEEGLDRGRLDPYEEALHEDHERLRVADDYRRSKSRKALSHG